MTDPPESIWRPTDSLATRVYLVRRQTGLDQRRFADLCGITYGEIQGIEKGSHVRDELRKIRAIALATRADEDWLRDGGPLDPDPRFGVGLARPQAARGAATGRYSSAIRHLRLVPAAAA